MTRRDAIGPAVIAVAVLAAVVWARAVDLHVDVQASSPVPPAVPMTAGADARALLDDLKEGDALVGWTVDRIVGPVDGELRVHLRRDGVGFALMVARKDAHPHAAPLTTDKYAIFYGHAEPADAELPRNTTRATSHALARRIHAREAEVTVAGM